jgi:BlaI family penicillinase repressor
MALNNTGEGSMASTKLGRVQLMIMQVLWAKGRASAREITEALNRSEPLAHSTVQTLLRGLEEKGSVAHEIDGRTFVFYPLVNEDKFKRSATRELLQRVFGGDISSLVAHLLKHEKISAKEMSEIRKLIDERDKHKQ